MPSFLRKRLQVFVSSTYTDLKEERQAAVEAILTAGQIPAGMELFTAGDESQMEVIKRWIDESDVYLLILGGRYGSLEPKTGQSYIELEYRYALDQQKALFACVANEAALEDRVKGGRGSEIVERENPQKLKEFRAFVLTKMVRFWDDYKDIKIAVGETLSDFARRDELVGWVRGDQGTNPAVTDELARLSKENAELRSRLAAVRPQGLTLGLDFDELLSLVTERGLLDYLRRNRESLGCGTLRFDRKSNEQAGLAAIGLIAREQDTNGRSYWRLTEPGNVFLNRVALGKSVEELPSNSPPSAGSCACPDIGQRS